MPDSEECVHEVFAKNAELYPNAQAICSWDGNMTYDELEECSTRLSYYLMSAGIKPKTIVPLAFEKSTWVIVAILGILKAGGCCVALDAFLPLGRLQAIIQATQPRIVLSSASQHEKMKNLVDKMIVIDRDFISSLPTQASTVNARSTCPDIRPHHLAFITFTSGTTGKPKGVMLEHRTVCFSSRIHAHADKADSNSRYLQFSSFTFDVYISDILIPLLIGGCVCIPTEEERRSDLAAAINRLKVTHAILTPTVATFYHQKTSLP